MGDPRSTRVVRFRTESHAAGLGARASEVRTRMGWISILRRPMVGGCCPRRRGEEEEEDVGDER